MRWGWDLDGIGMVWGWYGDGICMKGGITFNTGINLAEQ